MASCGSPLINAGPTAHWIGPEMLVDLVVEGRESKALANSGSQVNTVPPTFVHQHELPILSLVDLVAHPLNLVGLGGWHTSPQGFIILCVQVKEITGYDEDIVFLIIPDESEFSRWVLLVIGTCTLGRIMNVV